VCAPSGLATLSSADTGDTPNSASGKQPVKVTATTSIIADLVQNVGGDHVDVYTILAPGTDAHTYSPKPSDVQAVAESQILFRNGLGLETWLDPMIQNAGGSRPIVVVSDGLTPLTDFKAEHDDEEHIDEAGSAPDTVKDGEENEERPGTEPDPHMWFDVQRTIGYVENIRDRLKQLDPANAPAYEANADTYIDQLEQLDTEILQWVGTVPPERRKLVTSHDNFGYFAHRYGFEIVGSVLQSFSTEEQPSAQQIVELVEQIKEQQVPAIFTENVSDPRLAEQVADEAGIDVVTNLYTDALGEPGSAGDTYIKMMRFNVQQIVEALR
jgi:zinc/manganese transport system substrate-binding protein